MKLKSDEFFIVSVMAPLLIALVVLFSSVKTPSELFSEAQVKMRKKVQMKVPVKESPKEEVKETSSLPSLSDSLMAPAPSVGGDLRSLSAGVVGEGSGGSGGMAITQGDQSPGDLVASTQTEDRPARVVQFVSPVYPQSAQARGIEGFVVLEVVISENGQVLETKIINAEPQGLFDQVAVEAIRKWSFEPGRQNGKTVVSRIKQKVNFELN